MRRNLSVNHNMRRGKFLRASKAARTLPQEDRQLAAFLIAEKGQVMNKYRIVHTSKTRKNGMHFIVEYDHDNKEFTTRIFRDGVLERVCHGYEELHEAISRGNDEVDEV